MCLRNPFIYENLYYRFQSAGLADKRSSMGTALETIHAPTGVRHVENRYWYDLHSLDERRKLSRLTQVVVVSIRTRTADKQRCALYLIASF